MATSGGCVRENFGLGSCSCSCHDFPKGTANHCVACCAYSGQPRSKEINEASQGEHQLPRDKSYPNDAVQCDGCGGRGCNVCDHKGWLPHGHPKGRKCHRDECPNPIPPSQIAVYCSNTCALADA